MKKTFAIITILSLLTLFACKKAAVQSGGSWTFKGVTYQSQFTDWVLNVPGNSPVYLASTGTGSPVGTLGFYFYFPFDSIANSIKPKSGNYTVTNSIGGTPADSMLVFIQMTDTSATATYTPTPTAASAGIMATVTRLSNGELSISLPATEIAYGRDSGVLTANITYLP